MDRRFGCKYKKFEAIAFKHRSTFRVQYILVSEAIY